jgi:hypothetical protein
MALVRSYKSKMTLLGVAALSAAVLAGAVGSLVIRYGQPGQNFWLVYPVLLAVCALAFAAVVPWWRKLDDLQQEGQLVSWYWGGQVGAVVVLMALVAAFGTNSDFARGGLAVFLGEGTFFGAAWLIWRWRSRGPSE